MSERDNATENVARSFRLAQESMREFRASIEQQRFYLEEAMGLNDDLNASADKLQKSIDDAQDAVQKHSDKQAQIIADLQKQVDAGLTPVQAQALLTRLQGSQTDIQTTADSLADVATDPTPATPVINPGETSVSVAKDAPSGT